MLLLVPTLLVAAIELPGFDGEVMQAMDEAYKDLEPVLGASNAQQARENLAVLQEAYQWTLDYFTPLKSEAPDAIDFAVAGQKKLQEIDAAIGAGNFDQAAEKARELNANCKSCHDKYKSSLSR